ncbi:MAG: lipid-A-disaccharide synthase [Verrucomicrobia bacterium]|nr:lipid-A-disaccharide synthase [Verrucomicrobiota bacterium]
MSETTFMLIAGEASGDWLAAELVQALKASPELRANPFPARFFGAGGPRMAAAGVELALDLTQHSVIGLQEALRNYAKFKRIFDQLLALAGQRQPDVIVCVDFSGFNRRFARAVRKLARARRNIFNDWQPKIVQYVSPQVWASRPGRATQMARDYDLLLSVIPFEKDWYAARVPELRVEFVGHPLVERHTNSEFRIQNSESDEPTAGVSIGNRKSEILLLPGSRVDELRRHLPAMIEAAKIIQRTAPQTHFRMVLPNESLRDQAKTFTAPLAGLETQIGSLADALRSATVAVASTGTVTLECAFFGVPTVALYKTSWSTYLIGRQIVTVDFLAMPNLLAGEAVFPEFIQRAATGENLARAALELLNNPERRAAVKAKLAEAVKSLGAPGASGRAARAVLKLLETPSSCRPSSGAPECGRASTGLCPLVCATLLLELPALCAPLAIATTR